MSQLDSARDAAADAAQEELAEGRSTLLAGHDQVSAEPVGMAQSRPHRMPVGHRETHSGAVQAESGGPAAHAREGPGFLPQAGLADEVLGHIGIAQHGFSVRVDRMKDMQAAVARQPGRHLDCGIRGGREIDRHQHAPIRPVRPAS